ncbi:MAG: hypothetical protein HQ503_18710 [Rhodospirillales bacterium]|nr:hypothetical protein [Rhodospirillales bacterium]
MKKLFSKTSPIIAVVAVGMSIMASMPERAVAGATPMTDGLVFDAQYCTGPIHFPQNKEELSRFDVEQAFAKHFTRDTSIPVRVDTSYENNDIIHAHVYVGDGPAQWTFRVDAVDARIVTGAYHPPAVGFTSHDDGDRGASNLNTVSATARLRRHMLGDGLPWADWAAGLEIPCQDDYRFGGPDIPTEFNG